MELSKKLKRKWVLEHSHEIFLARQRGNTIADLMRKYKTTDYYIYAALFVEGGESYVPNYLLRYIRNTFKPKSAKSGQRSPIRRNASHLAEEKYRELALNQADKILADHNKGFSVRELALKYKMSDYYIQGALFHRGVNVPSTNVHAKNWAKWKATTVGSKARAASEGDPRSVQAAKVAVINKAWEECTLEPTPLKHSQPRSADEALKKELKQDTTLVYRQDQKIKSLEAEVEQWVKEVERLTLIEKKYHELMAAYNEKIAAEVAAEETLAHKG